MIQGIQKEDVSSDLICEYRTEETRLNPEHHTILLTPEYFYITSKSLVPEKILLRITQYCVSRLVSVLPALSLTDTQQLFTKVTYFFKVSSHYACLILSELIHSVHLIDRLICRDAQTQDHKQRIIRHSNIGTLLLCSIIIAVKYVRDIPFTNSWWSENICVPLSIVTESEFVFLKHIQFNVSFSESRYKQYFTLFVSTS